MKDTIKEKDKFLKEYKAKYEKKGNESDLGVKEATMKDILKDMTGMPERVHIMGPLSKPSAKTAKAGENQLQGGESKMIIDEKETPQRKIEG